MQRARTAGPHLQQSELDVIFYKSNVCDSQGTRSSVPAFLCRYNNRTKQV